MNIVLTKTDTPDSVLVSVNDAPEKASQTLANIMGDFANLRGVHVIDDKTIELVLPKGAQVEPYIRVVRNCAIVFSTDKVHVRLIN